MSRITSTAQHGITRSLFALALLGAPQAAFADAGNYWSINMAESKFSDGQNTLVVERHGGAPAAKRVGGSIVLISRGNIYLASPGTPSGSRLNGMNVEQIGANVHAVGSCGTFCQQTRPNNRLVLSFTSVNAGPHDMGQSVVFNSK